MPRGFSQQERELIAGRLLEQGDRQFTALGLRKTSVEDLARAAGISKGAFYLFYDSKEALFMDVVERAERRFRVEVLAAVDRPGPTPRARLLAVFKQAFTLLRTIPVLQVFTGSDFDLLFRRIPAEKLQEHLASDRQFFDLLLGRCQAAGITIRARTEDIIGLFYTLVISVLHQDDFGTNNFPAAVDMLMELIAAYCVGEVEL
jgi:AcrR family transcriptional regulator